MHSRLEQYLDELERPLTGVAPQTRNEWREEARQHLLALAAAHEEMGSPPEQALEAALRQFGHAPRIGKQLRRSLLGHPLNGRVTFALFSGPVIASLLLMIGLGYAYVLSGSPAALAAMRISGACAFVAVPVIGGWRIGTRQRRGWLGWRVLAALTLSALAFVPIAGVLSLCLSFFEAGAGAVPDLWQGLLWLPIAAGSALLASGSSHRAAAGAG